MGNIDIAPSSNKKSWRLDLVACSFKSPVPHNTELISQYSAVRWLNLTEISHQTPTLSLGRFDNAVFAVLW